VNATTAPTPFVISGSVSGLYPGAHKTLDLHVRNRLSYTITVTLLATTVRSSTTGCAATAISVGTYRGSRRAARYSTIVIAVPVTMSHAAPNACKGARFVLTYRGSAV
jgi:hypothetical protein